DEDSVDDLEALKEETVLRRVGVLNAGLDNQLAAMGGHATLLRDDCDLRPGRNRRFADRLALLLGLNYAGRTGRHGVAEVISHRHRFRITRQTNLALQKVQLVLLIGDDALLLGQRLFLRSQFLLLQIEVVQDLLQIGLRNCAAIVGPRQRRAGDRVTDSHRRGSCYQATAPALPCRKQPSPYACHLPNPPLNATLAQARGPCQDPVSIRGRASPHSSARPLIETGSWQ